MIVVESCPTLCDPMDCSLSGSSVQGNSPRQEYWSGLPFPSPRDLSNPGTEPRSPVSPALQTDSLPLSHQGSPWHIANAQHISCCYCYYYPYLIFCFIITFCQILGILKGVRFYPSMLQASRRDRKVSPKLQNSIWQAYKRAAGCILQRGCLFLFCVCGGKRLNKVTSTGVKGSGRVGRGACHVTNLPVPQLSLPPLPSTCSNIWEHLSSKEISQDHTYVILTWHDRYPEGLQKEEAGSLQQSHLAKQARQWKVLWKWWEAVFQEAGLWSD